MRSIIKIILSLIAPFVLFFSTCHADDEFENPGGMWMPEQMPAHGDLLKKLGLEIDPQELNDPSSTLLQAIVSLGGCSGSFISKEGLIVTNHHCVESILAYMSQQDQANGIKDADYVKTGYIARNRGEERFANPDQKIYITTKIEDVTKKVRRHLDKINDPNEREKIIRKRIYRLVKKSEARDPNLKTEVVSYFRDEKYFLIERVRLKDIRLVYAPPKNVGYYGGDVHNWHYPRFAGDFALLRAYVDKDQKPSAPSQNNVPYVPKQILTVANNGLEENDLVLVAGYPGRTESLNTLEEDRYNAENFNPYLAKKYADIVTSLDGLMARYPELKAKASSRRFGASNVEKKKRTALELIKAIRFLEMKEAYQRDLMAWISQSESNTKKYGRVIEEMNEIQMRNLETSPLRRATVDLYSQSDILASAVRIVRKAKQAHKPDDERSEEFQSMRLDQLPDLEKRIQSRYDRRIDVALVTTMVKRARELPADMVPKEALEVLLGADAMSLSEQQVASRLDELLGATSLESLDFRMNLLENGKIEDLRASDDPVLKVALYFADKYDEFEEMLNGKTGDMLLVSPLYVKAVRAFERARGRQLAPDANSTLRITFGQVRGMTKPDGKYYEPFTHLRDLLGLHKAGDEDFEVPANVLAAIENGDHSPFADKTGDVPIDFIANVHTTGGNSGSAAMNSKGQLVGLLFDGVEETLYSDYMFDSNVRSVLLDIRYMLWTLYNVEHAEHLIKEMNLASGCGSLFN